MILAEDVYKDLPNNNSSSATDLYLKLWNETLIVDPASWTREQYNNKFYWEKEDNLDPLFGLDLQKY